MHNSIWKKERDLLSEAYDSIAETTHSPENSCKDDEYYCDKDKVCKKKENANEAIDPTTAVDLANADRPAGDEELPEPGESPDDTMPDQALDTEVKELDADVKDLISLIANPPPEEELTRLGYEGRLSEYVAMLQKKVDAAQAQLDLRKPAEESGA